MEIIIRKVTESNLIEVIQDPDTYVIRKGWLGEKFQMTPIQKADVGDLLNKANVIIKIVSN